jgi:hypothetical protein
MSTTASRVVELVKSLPEADQMAIRAALADQAANGATVRRRRLHRLPDGGYLNPRGIPNDDPVFNILDEIEKERHWTQGPIIQMSSAHSMVESSSRAK